PCRGRQAGAAGHDGADLALHGQEGGVRLPGRQGDLGGRFPVDRARHGEAPRQRVAGGAADAAGSAHPGERRPQPRPADADRLPLVLLERAGGQDQQRHARRWQRRGAHRPPGRDAVPGPARESRDLTMPPWLSRLLAGVARRTQGSEPGSGSGPGPGPGPPPRASRWQAVRTPTVLQMEAVECGAAALAIVLAHHGGGVPREVLRTACGVSRDGRKASNMVKAARTLGLVAKGYKKEPADLRGMAPPMIVHWNFNHFLVLEGFRQGRVHLNDPASGPRTVSEEELDQSLTGVVLTVQPGPDFRAGGEAPRLLAALGRRLAGARSALVFALATGLALAVPGLVAPAFSKVFVDRLLLEGQREWLGPLLAAMAAAALVLGTVTWLQRVYLLRLETQLALGASSR